MKSYADDYYMHELGVEMKMVRRSLYLYGLLHIHNNLGWRPSWDIYETEDDLIVLVEMAGIQAEHMEISVGRDQLQLRGNRCRPSEHEVTRIHRMEVDFGPYHQIIVLPEPVEPNGATSNYRDGFLLIRLPKEVQNTSSVS
jgi:HSP20 family protein